MAFAGSLESPSPSSVSFPGSGGPYAIVSSSTGITTLSRSNSLSGRAQTPVLYNSSPNAKPLGRSQSRGHRHARSLSNAPPPQPLPLPAKRRDSQGSSHSGSLPPTPNEASIAQLPDNPKDWLPSQLSVYLSSALRLKRGGSIPAPVAKDIAAFALREKLGGRAFLRLSDENLKAMGVNHLWREALLSASRTLRKKVLKGRIWGFGSAEEAVEENDTPTKQPKRRVPSTVDEDAPESPVESPVSSGFRGGRVRGMIESLERSSSSDEHDDEHLESVLRNKGLWISEGSDAEDDDTDQIGNLSASSSSDNELGEDYHSRDSSGSQPPAYTRDMTRNGLEEPSIEELLASTGPVDVPDVNHQRGRRAGGTLDEVPSWGAMMWEQDNDIAGGTAKKIVVPSGSSSTRSRIVNGGPQVGVHNLFAPVEKDLPEVKSEETSTRPDEEAQVLLQAFKLRLEQMEKRLVELELRDEQRERELVSLREAQKQAQQPTPVAAPQVTKKPLSSDSNVAKPADKEEYDEFADIAWQAQPRASRTDNHAAPTSSKSARTEHQSLPNTVAMMDHKYDDPPLEMTPDPSPSALPSYVFLVGVGVCAVVIRVLFRQVGGGRRA